MKIVFTGGGTAGHFYPTIAVAQQVNAIAEERKLLRPKLYYIGPTPYDRKALYENNMYFKKSPAGKLRRYFSIFNFFDACKTLWGILKTIFQIYLIYPDVVFSKGGYASFPAVVAAWFFRIPLTIHESDATPGRVNRLSGKFARRIAISYPEAAQYFDDDKTALTGNPVRKELFTIAPEGGREFLELEPNTPTVLVLGGSQGARAINETLLDALPDLLNEYHVVHQTGDAHIEEVKRIAETTLHNHPHKSRYKPFDFLQPLALRMAAGAAELIVSRAGSGAIFEIALWEKPSIVIPIPEDISQDQRRNAFAYARSGAASVIEQANLTPHVLTAEINRILHDETLRDRMRKASKRFAKPDAARAIAEEIVRMALEHEK